MERRLPPPWGTPLGRPASWCCTASGRACRSRGQGVPGGCWCARWRLPCRPWPWGRVCRATKRGRRSSRGRRRGRQPSRNSRAPSKCESSGRGNDRGCRRSGKSWHVRHQPTHTLFRSALARPDTRRISMRSARKSLGRSMGAAAAAVTAPAPVRPATAVEAAAVKLMDLRTAAAAEAVGARRQSTRGAAARGAVKAATPALPLTATARSTTMGST